MEDIKIKKEYVGLRRICPGFGVMVIGGFMPKDIVDAFKLAGVEIGEESELVREEVGKLESGEVETLHATSVQESGEVEPLHATPVQQGEKAKGKRQKG